MVQIILGTYIIKVLHLYLAILRCRIAPSTSEVGFEGPLNGPSSRIISVERSYVQLDLTPARGKNKRMCTSEPSSHRDPRSFSIG